MCSSDLQQRLLQRHVLELEDPGSPGEQSIRRTGVRLEPIGANPPAIPGAEQELVGSAGCRHPDLTMDDSDVSDRTVGVDAEGGTHDFDFALREQHPERAIGIR